MPRVIRACLKKLLGPISHSDLEELPHDLQWFIDETVYFRGTLFVTGWAFHPTQSICEVGYILPNESYQKITGYGLKSSDVESRFGKAARNCRLDFSLKVDNPESVLNLKLVFTIQDGSHISIDQFAQKRLSADPFHRLQARFYELLRQKVESGKVLEIGSRNRSGVIRRQLVPENLQYIGLDILNGDNVDVVGNAHALSTLFKPKTFDAIFATSVFEHLLMPWKVVLEMNQVMKPGGLVMITTHQTWPLHECPWDFWRFSEHSWQSLFNKYMGFEIIGTAMGEPASIVSHMLHPATLGLEQQPAFLGSAVLCRKIADSKLSWDVDVTKVTETMYPGDIVSP